MLSNKLLLILGIFIFNTSVFATDSLLWNIEGREYSIYFDKELQMMISSSCEKVDCGARKIAKNAQTLKVNRSQIESSQNPGSLYCHQLKGVVVIGHNERGSQNAFCQTTDKTIVDLSSLGSSK